MSNLRRLLMRHASSSIGLVAPMREANCEIGDVLLYDKNLARPCVLKASRFTKTQVEALDTTRYFNTKAVYFGKEKYESNGEVISCKGLWIAPAGPGNYWAQDNYYTLTPSANCFANGATTKEISFSITIVGGDTSTGAMSITVPSGSTLANIASLIHNAKQNVSGASGRIAVGTYKESSSASVTAVGINTWGWSTNLVSISNVSTTDGVADVALYDFSMDTKYDGTLIATRSHRSYQGSYVNSLWNSLGLSGFKWPGNSTACYARNGHNLSYWSGGNFNKFKSYVRSSGGTSVVDDVDGATAPMNYATWQSIKDPNSQYYSIYSKYLNMYNNQSSAPQKSWIDMYGTPTADETEGPYDLYVMSRMTDTEWINNNTSGVLNLFYQPKTPSYTHTGLTGTASLAKLTFDGFAGRGSASSSANAFVLTANRPCYPAASYCYNYEPANLPSDSAAQVMSAHNWNLATTYQVALFMRDDIMKIINSSWTKVSAGTSLVNTSYYWSLSEYDYGIAWFYYGDSGRFHNNIKFYSRDSRPVLALDLPS